MLATFSHISVLADKKLGARFQLSKFKSKLSSCSENRTAGSD